MANTWFRLAPRAPRGDASSVSSSLKSVEWLFPVRGRWLQYLIGVAVIVVGLWVYIGIAMALCAAVFGLSINM